MTEPDSRDDIRQRDDGFVALVALTAPTGVGDLSGDRHERWQAEAFGLFRQKQGSLGGFLELVQVVGLLHHVDLFAEINQKPAQLFEQGFVFDPGSDRLAISTGHAVCIGCSASAT